MFALMKMPDGKRLLVNMDLMFAVQEGESGVAIAVSMAGAGVPTGETFDYVLKELMGEIPTP